MLQTFSLVTSLILLANWFSPGSTPAPVQQAGTPAMAGQDCAPTISEQDGAPAIPEQDGDFPDSNHTGLRVRVFVHGAKDAQGAARLATCTDPDSTAVVPATGWKLPAGTWKYRLNVSSAPASVGAANFPTIASLGFGRWQAAQNRVTFARGADTTVDKNAGDGQNIIAWGRSSGSALAATYVRYSPSTGIVADVDTIINKRFAWRWTPYAPGACSSTNAYDAEAVLTHEQGHWLGLDDVYTAAFANNTMYGIGTPGALKADTLTTGDKAGAAAIYP